MVRAEGTDPCDRKMREGQRRLPFFTGGLWRETFRNFMNVKQRKSILFVHDFLIFGACCSLCRYFDSLCSFAILII